MENMQGTQEGELSGSPAAFLLPDVCLFCIVMCVDGILVEAVYNPAEIHCKWWAVL